MNDTIFALSSGAPPAAIGVVRISGPTAHEALRRLAGRVPEARRAALMTLRGADGGVLDRCLALRFDEPTTATGEDLVELHLHGGRAVVAAVLAAVGAVPGCRAAEAGEFTRRALANGRIDLTEAEGLADLLEAETEAQRRAAARAAGGAVSRWVEGLRVRALALAAGVEARLDFGDEDDVGEALPEAWGVEARALLAEVEEMLARPPVERLRDGFRVAIAGPPNAGKSSLLNALAGRDAAIVAPIAGTTRDVIEVPVSIGGTAFLLSDTAGLRDADDPVEAIGVERARRVMDEADLILWLGPVGDAPDDARAVAVLAKADLGGAVADGQVAVSSMTGTGMAELVALLLARAGASLPPADALLLNARQRLLIGDVAAALAAAIAADDLLITAEELRLVRAALDAITGRADVEDMLDALFGRFCIGK